MRLDRMDAEQNMDPIRQKLLDEAKRQTANLTQYFNDVAHWNDCVRKPDELPIDPDPDGKMAKIKTALDRMIEQG